MLYCKECGNSVAKGVAKCGNCGATFNISTKNMFSSKKNILSLVIIFLLIIYIVAIFNISENKRTILTYKKAAIGHLLSFRQIEEDYKSANSSFGTVEELIRFKKNELLAEKYGYIFEDLIKKPDSNFFAIMASPKYWGKNMDCYYFITNNGIIKKWEEKDLPFSRSLPPEKGSIDKIEQLKNAF